MRSLIRLVRCGRESRCSTGRFDDAFHWIQTGFAMARHASQGPLLVQSLVGVTPEPGDVQAAGRPDPGPRRAKPLLGYCATGRIRSPTSQRLRERAFPARTRDSVAARARWACLERRERRDFSTELQDKLLQACSEIADGSGTSELAGLDCTDWAWPPWSSRFIPRPSAPLIAQGRQPSRSRRCRPSRSPSCTRFGVRTASRRLLQMDEPALSIRATRAWTNRSWRGRLAVETRTCSSNSSPC